MWMFISVLELQSGVVRQIRSESEAFENVADLLS